MHAYRDQYAQLFNDGQDVVLIAISVDPIDTLAAWAHDDQFQFLMASDSGAAVGRMYGALTSRGNQTNRNLFAVPFHEIDPTAYTELGDAIHKLAPPE